LHKLGHGARIDKATVFRLFFPFARDPPAMMVEDADDGAGGLDSLPATPAGLQHLSW